MACDLLVKNGQVFDPPQKVFRNLDIAITNGRVSRVTPALEGVQAREVMDASGLIVTPGSSTFMCTSCIWSTGLVFIPKT